MTEHGQSYDQEYGTPAHSGERLRLLESIVSNVGDAILGTEAGRIDEPGPKVVYVNESFTRMTGYSSDEILGKTPRILQGPGTDRNRLDGIRAALSEGKPIRTEFLNYRKDGTEFWVEIDIEPVTDEHGNHTHWVSVQRDITERRKQDVALEESEERLRTILVQYASDMITILEPDGTVRYESPAVEKVLGYKPEELVGKNILDYVHPEDVDRASRELDRVWDEPGVRGPVEVRFRHEDGSWRCLEAVGNNLLGDPAVGGVVINSRNVTERKDAEVGYRSIFENAAEGIYRTTREGRLIFANPALARIFGYGSPDEMTSELTNVGQNYVDPEQREEFVRLMRENGHVSGYEYRVKRKDGSIAWVSDSAREVRDEEGELLRYEGFIQDITERKRTEERLWLLESVAVNVNDAVLITDAWPFEEPGGPRIVYANDAFTCMSGYTPEEVIGGTPRLLQGEKTDRGMLDEIRRSLSSWEPVRVEVINYRKDGSEFWVELNIAPVADESGRITRWVSVQRETTGRRRVEERLRKSEADLKRAQRIAHLGNWEWNPISGDLTWSDEVFRVYGFTTGEFAPTFNKFTEAVHPEDRERVTKAIDDSINKGEPFDLEHRLVLTEGGERIVHCQGEVEWDEYGEPLMMFGTVQDVTEQRLAEKALEESGRLFRSVVQNSSEVVKITDADGTLRYASPAFERIFGYDPEEDMGTNVLDYVHSEDLPRIQEETKKALENPGTTSNMVEYRFRHADGSWRWVESVGTYLIDDPAVEGVVVNVRDVTERRRAQMALEESEQRLKAVAAGAPVIMFAIDPEGVFTFESGAALRDLGLEPGVNVGRSVFEAYTDFPKVLDNVRRSLAGEEVVDTVEIGRKAYHAAYSPQRDADGKVHGIIGVATDVTERRRLERDLEHMATHDPLTGLANRRLLFALLARALQSLERFAQREESVCLLYVDLDGFKEINDRYRHEVGDALLAAMAGRIEGCLRPSDTAARVGGDEFCVLLERASGAEEAIRVAERLATSLEAPFSLGDTTVNISASIGIAVKDAGSSGLSSDELMREADMAMYRAKAKVGRSTPWSK